MALAQRLNDLALANSNGLLNDDEYRLLRQNVFEEYSSNVVIPVEAPVVPIAARLDVHVRTRPSASRATTSPSLNHQRNLPKHSHDSRKSIATPGRQKSSVTSGVASLIRKATGRRTPVSIHEPSTTPARDSHKLDIAEHDSPHKFMVILPKLLQRKPSTLRKDPPKLLSDTWSSSRSTNTSSSTSNTSHSISLLTPTRGYLHSANVSSSSLRLSHDKSPSTPRDVFDDENLDTAKDIHGNILITEDELQTLTDAFNNLESTALRRVQKQRARRLPINTPSSVDVLLEGREWREHRLIPSSSSPSLDASRRRSRMLRSFDSNGSGDGHSIRSSSSNQTNLSQSRSVTSIPRVTPASSPLSATFPFRNTTRSNSISSNSSHGASSFTSGGMLAPTPTVVSLTRSASHLCLRRKPKAPAGSGITSVSQETIYRPSHDLGDDEDIEDDPELVDIRRRRVEVIARYTARLDFLRAKLKGAELHEKLLRK
ncbi:hypothetical protein CPB83DRAFT_889549 [Crepidotus variabilis]|uniref:Uncharacterized protein n=1 Tax=Crepidotus variabilis TaxID=179855 RepID=A0A9P6JVC2_9AGAR|nr:hypothetical protein CPB83DRAFT_889549 [Crepidotus variabilis]